MFTVCNFISISPVLVRDLVMNLFFNAVGQRQMMWFAEFWIWKMYPLLSGMNYLSTFLFNIPYELRDIFSIISWEESARDEMLRSLTDSISVAIRRSQQVRNASWFSLSLSVSCRIRMTQRYWGPTFVNGRCFQRRVITSPSLLPLLKAALVVGIISVVQVNANFSTVLSER